MLSTNSILQQGRYRIIGQFGTAGGCALYDAYDNLLGNKVVLHETVLSLSKAISDSERGAHAAAFTERIKRLKEIRHDGFVRVRDGFSEVDRHYLVSEPVEGKLSHEEFVTRPRETINRLLTAIEYINEVEKRFVALEITPAHIRRTSDGNNRLLFFGIGISDVEDRSQLPYKPLESLWDGLDLASQKAISNDYSEARLETLESDPDSRTNIYSLGATLYQILTGTAPADALERSIELLDGKADPLTAPTSLSPTLSIDSSDFILKAMQIRRENRYQNVAEARSALPNDAAPKVQSVVTAPVEDLDEFDLLELLEVAPATPVAAPLRPVIPKQPVVSRSSTVAAHSFSGVGTATLDEPTPASNLPRADNTAIRDAQAEILTPKPVISASHSVEQSETEVKQPVDKESFSFDIEPPAKSKVARFATMGIAAAVLIGAVIWGFVAFSSSGQSVSGKEYDNGAAVMKDQLVAPAESPLPASLVETTVAPETPDTLPSQQTTSPSVEKTAADQTSAGQKRPVIAEVKPLKPEPSTAAQKPAPTKTKKSVTVDDLISDN